MPTKKKKYYAKLLPRCLHTECKWIFFCSSNYLQNPIWCKSRSFFVKPQTILIELLKNRLSRIVSLQKHEGEKANKLSKELIFCLLLENYSRITMGKRMQQHQKKCSITSQEGMEKRLSLRNHDYKKILLMIICHLSKFSVKKIYPTES